MTAGRGNGLQLSARKTGGKKMDNMSDYKVFIDRVEEEIPVLLERHAVPGLAIALIREAGICWRRGFGCRDRETEAPVTADTVFEAASLTKPVVALLALRLHDTGVLDLDAPLADYARELPISDDPRLRRITPRIILSHATGFPNWRKYEPDGKLRIKFDPGERFGYSGEGYLYLQKVLESLTGQPLAEYAAANLLEPLGLSNTGLVWQDNYSGRFARPHGAKGEPEASAPYKEANAAYTMYTTPVDFAAFMIKAVLKPDGGKAALRPATAAEMLRPQTRVNETTDWGLGWGIKHTDGGDAFWHWGDNGGTRNLAAGFRDSGTGIVLMTNGENGLDVCNAIMRQLPGQPVDFDDFFTLFYSE